MNTDDNKLTHEQDDFELTRPILILDLDDNSSSGIGEEFGSDPYNSGCIRIARKWPSRSKS